MIKYYDCVSEWIIDNEPEEADDIITMNELRAFGNYCGTTHSDKFFDCIVQAFVDTKHIEVMEDGRIRRLPFCYWDKEEANIINLYEMSSKQLSNIKLDFNYIKEF